MLEKTVQIQKKSPDNQAQMEPLKLGERVKAIRLAQKLTLEDASNRTGLARSTLSKIENEQISPTFTVVNKLISGLGINIPQLFSQPNNTNMNGRRDVTRGGEGLAHPTSTYEHEILATQLSHKKMIPYRTKVRARDFNQYSDWIRHDGEEFLFVLQGSVLFYSEFYEPLELFTGDSTYYDCEMGHVLVSTSEEDAEVIWVTA